MMGAQGCLLMFVARTVRCDASAIVEDVNPTGVVSRVVGKQYRVGVGHAAADLTGPVNVAAGVPSERRVLRE